MKIRIALLATAAMIALAAFAPSASALTRSLKVTTTPSIVNECRSAPDQAMWSFAYKSTIKRKNVAAPSRVTVRYRVTDAATGALLAEQKLTLKPRKYYKVGLPVIYTAGTQVILKSTATFKNPYNGRNIKASGTDLVNVPTIEQLDTGVFPACPPAVG